MSGSVDLGGRRIIKKIFFKQKTAYEIVTGDWSSDVCSSDLLNYQGFLNIVFWLIYEIVSFFNIIIWQFNFRDRKSVV